MYLGDLLCRFLSIPVVQEAQEQRPVLQPPVLPVSGPARAPARQQQRPPAGRGERDSLQGVLSSVTAVEMLNACYARRGKYHVVVFLDPGEAAASSSQVKRLWKDLRGYRSGRDVSPQLF